MFNTFSEHLFASQSLLKERRRLPTGGLREVFEESFEGRASTPSPFGVGSKKTPRASKVQFTGYCFVRSCPHRGASCRSLFSYCGNPERVCAYRVRNPEHP